MADKIVPSIENSMMAWDFMKAANVAWAWELKNIWELDKGQRQDWRHNGNNVLYLLKKGKHLVSRSIGGTAVALLKWIDDRYNECG